MSSIYVVVETFKKTDQRPMKAFFCEKKAGKYAKEKRLQEVRESGDGEYSLTYEVVPLELVD